MIPPAAMPVMGAYWNGDEWRWRLAVDGPRAISVIEPGEKSDAPANAQRRMPFGFSRVLGPISPGDPCEPLLWEGED